MSQLVYSHEELLRSHDYARPHRVADKRLHGGFDEHDHYLPPRALVRAPAIEAWLQALRARGGDLMSADASLLEGIRYPSEAQMKLLIQEGLGQFFWNTLTITGLIEGRGRILADMHFPDLQGAIWEDISEMGVGHLNKGLLFAHGIDEGGEPHKGIGGHDVMWFALRDLAYGDVDYPEPEVPERITRPDDLQGEVREIEAQYQPALSMLLNLLLIEFRAELGFRFSETLLRDPALFVGRREQAEEAALIVGRIRADEEIHVRSLRLYLGELRQLTFRTRDGGRKPGTELIDPFWERIVHWATVEQPKLAVVRERALMPPRILAHPGGEAEGRRVLAAFQALDEVGNPDDN